MTKTNRDRVWRTAAVAAVVLATGGTAEAFYWKGWPGSRVPPEQSLVPTTHRSGATPGPDDGPFGPPPVETPLPHTDFPPPPGNPEPPPGNPPEHVPEPASGVVALVGLGVIAARRWGRKANGPV